MSFGAGKSSRIQSVTQTVNVDCTFRMLRVQQTVYAMEILSLHTYGS